MFLASSVYQRMLAIWPYIKAATANVKIKKVTKRQEKHPSTVLRILIFHCLPTRGHSATSLQRTQPADPSKQAIFKLHCLILVLTHKYLHIINVTEIWLYFGITLKNVILLWNFHSHFGLNCDVVGFFFNDFSLFCDIL